MKTAIIIHGMPTKNEYFKLNNASSSNKHWFPWIQKQLILNGILAQTPEMPEPYKPDYKKWCSVFKYFNLDRDTVLVGHSCGAGFLVRFLSENKVKVGKVILVAPWINPDKKEDTKMFDFIIDKNIVNRTKGIIIFNSTDDYKEVKNSVHILQNDIKGIQTKNFKNYGHFCLSNMKTEAFPELLKEILR